MRVIVTRSIMRRRNEKYHIIEKQRWPIQKKNNIPVVTWQGLTKIWPPSATCVNIRMYDTCSVFGGGEGGFLLNYKTQEVSSRIMVLAGERFHHENHHCLYLQLSKLIGVSTKIADCIKGEIRNPTQSFFVPTLPPSFMNMYEKTAHHRNILAHRNTISLDIKRTPHFIFCNSSYLLYKKEIQHVQP